MFHHLLSPAEQAPHTHLCLTSQQGVCLLCTSTAGQPEGSPLLGLGYPVPSASTAPTSYTAQETAGQHILWRVHRTAALLVVLHPPPTC